MAEPEIVEPAEDVTAQFDDDVLHPMAPVAPGDFTHPAFEACENLSRPHHPTASTDLKPQEGALPKRRSVTLGPIDHQLEWPFHEARQARHHPLSRLRALHQNQEVVSVPGKTMPASFKLLVQRVERDIGQQGRQRTALGHTLRRGLAGCRRAGPRRP